MEEKNNGTFIVQVSATDHDDWQGQITWADKKMVQNFRSTLELLKLMESALHME